MGLERICFFLIRLARFNVFNHNFLKMKDELFKDYQKRLDVLDEDIRAVALKYAKDFHLNEKCSKEEAIERGLVKAEMEKRKIQP